MRMSDIIKYLSFGKTKYSEEEYLLLYESYCDLRDKYHEKATMYNYLKVLLSISIITNLFLIYYFS